MRPPRLALLMLATKRSGKTFSSCCATDFENAFRNAPHRFLDVERGTLKLLVQRPDCFDAEWNRIVREDFTHPAYRRVFEVATAGERGVPGWLPSMLDSVCEPVGQQLIISLSVESLLREPSAHYAREYAARLRLLSVTRDIATVKSRLQRTNPLEHQAEYNRMFAQLLDLESRRRDLQAEAVGEE